MGKNKKAFIFGGIGLVIVAAVVIILVLTLGGDPLEKLSSSRSIIHRVNDYEAYYIYFEDGNVEVNHNFYRDAEPVEKEFYKSDYVIIDSKSTSDTYPYKLSGSQIEVNGEMYEYKISNDKLYIEPIFLGVSTIWE